MGLVKVFAADMEYEAVAIRDLLEQSGIPCLVKSNDMVGLDVGMFSMNTNSWGDVLVEEEHSEKAFELIAGFQGTLGELREAEAAPEED